MTEQHAEETSRFLSENYANITPGKGEMAFNLLDSSISDTRIFLAGEIHGIAQNHGLYMSLLQYLHEKADIRYLIEETPYSTSRIINKYLHTGDESLLTKTFEATRGTFNWTEEKYQTWVKVYEMNKSLPEDEKLSLVGIDIEHQTSTALWYLTSLIPPTPAPSVISTTITELERLYQENDFNNDKVKDFCLVLQKSITKNRDVYQEWLGDNFFDFEFVNRNLLNKFEVISASNNQFNQIRDERMYQNFTAVYPRFVKGTCFGQWGLNHVFQKKQSSTDWLASRINSESSPLKGKVTSIVYAYQDCTQMLNRTYESHPQTTFNSNLNSLKELAASDVTLFRLTGQNSPFGKYLIWPFKRNIGSAPKEGVTGDYFQYLILIKNGTPTTPFK